MNDTKLAQMISAAIVLDREIKTREAELNNIKKQLVAEAESRPDEHTDTDGGGKSWTSVGTCGCMARVTFPGRSLKDKIDGSAKAFPKLKELAGKFFARLFTPTDAYKPAENFRDQASALLEPKVARRLIKLVEKDSDPRVSFETKKKEG